MQVFDAFAASADEVEISSLCNNIGPLITVFTYWHFMLLFIVMCLSMYDHASLCSFTPIKNEFDVLLALLNALSAPARNAQCKQTRTKWTNDAFRTA